MRVGVEEGGVGKRNRKMERKAIISEMDLVGVLLTFFFFFFGGVWFGWGGVVDCIVFFLTLARLVGFDR